MKQLCIAAILIFYISCGTKKLTPTLAMADNHAQNFPRTLQTVSSPPAKENVWVFIMAGQSNMAGRGMVEPKDTIPDDRIFSIDASSQLVYAKEPLHFYEPTLTGLDCGLSFGKALIKSLPSNIRILIVPTAIGGSSISQWLGDSLYRNVRLLSNFTQKVSIAKNYGVIKGILWHQGESDANAKSIPLYKDRLAELLKKFRAITGNTDLPVLVGELGSYSKDPLNWQKINEAVKTYAATDTHTAVISTADLKNKGDDIHFNSEGQRLMGQRFAAAYISKFR